MFRSQVVKRSHFALEEHVQIEFRINTAGANKAIHNMRDVDNVGNPQSLNVK